MKDKHERIREKLVEAAESIFTRFGFEKATMNDIAREARKGKSSLYYYFASKEEIFKAVVDVEARRFKEIIASSLYDIDDVKTKIRIYFTVRMNRFKELGNLYAAMRHDYLKKFDFVETLRAKYDHEELDYIKALLDEGNQKGEFNISNTYDTSFALASAVKGLEFPLVLHHDKQDINDRIDSLINILFYGIVKREIN